MSGLSCGPALARDWAFEKGFKKHGINVIRFLTPESRDEDITVP